MLIFFLLIFEKLYELGLWNYERACFYFAWYFSWSLASASLLVKMVFRQAHSSALFFNGRKGGCMNIGWEVTFSGGSSRSFPWISSDPQAPMQGNCKGVARIPKYDCHAPCPTCWWFMVLQQSLTPGGSCCLLQGPDEWCCGGNGEWFLLALPEPGRGAKDRKHEFQRSAAHCGVGWGEMTNAYSISLCLSLFQEILTETTRHILTTSSIHGAETARPGRSQESQDHRPSPS